MALPFLGLAAPEELRHRDLAEAFRGLMMLVLWLLHLEHLQLILLLLHLENFPLFYI